MPQFTCTCGNVLDLSDVWPECEWRLVPMTRIGEIADKLDAGKLPGRMIFIISSARQARLFIGAGMRNPGPLLFHAAGGEGGPG